MAVNLAPILNDAPYMDANGDPYTGALLYTYIAGSTTPANTYTTSAGSVANDNPLTLNSSGYPTTNGVFTQIWLTAGVSYKFVLKTAAGATLWTRDNVSGINDANVSVDQWASGPAPTYLSATTFSLVGDQTATFQVGRRLKTTNSGGTIYSTITISAYTSLTTITVVNDSGTLDSGLSAVSYGLLSPSNPSTPLLTDAYPIVSGSADATKKLRIEADTITTATTRVLTAQDADGTVGFIHPGVNDFRLSLTTALPVTTADVTGATTVYCVPYKGRKIALYNGTIWIERTSAEFSLALGTLSSGKPYDVFCYDNAGVPTLEFLVWTDDTTRATALTYQDGVLSKTGALTRRYLGTFYTTSTTQTEDSAAKRYLWNYYHRITRFMKVVDATNSWSYSTAAFQQANAAVGNQVSYVCGVAEDRVRAWATGFASNSTATLRRVVSGIGIDSTTVNSAQIFIPVDISNATIAGCYAHYSGIPAAGQHDIVWQEYGGGTDTQTWYGDNGAANLQTGLIAECMA